MGWNADASECGFRTEAREEEAGAAQQEKKYVAVLNRLLQESPSGATALSVATRVAEEVCEALSVGMVCVLLLLRLLCACFALLCFALLCFALLCFALLCFALLCFASFSFQSVV